MDVKLRCILSRIEVSNDWSERAPFVIFQCNCNRHALHCICCASV